MSVVPRAEWGHPGPVGRAMRLPATTLWIHHSVTQARNGVATPRQIANIGINRFGRSSYSYVVTPDGTIYELQGTHVGAHTGGHNSTTLALCFAGNYDRDEPTAAQIAAAGQLHRDLVAQGMLRPGAPIKGHRDASGASTACPGGNLYAALPRIREAAAGDAPTEEDDVLKEGDTGNTVRVMQWRINQGHPDHPSPFLADPRSEGGDYGLVADGEFGPATKAYVADLQAKWGYEATGVYDLPTALRLLEAVIKRGVIAKEDRP